tara:strand:- start:57 stop:707 length:651 start_codon:yes stop_codon:yes gene_type:complete
MSENNKIWEEDELKSLFIGLNSDEKYERRYSVKIGIEEGFVHDDGQLDEKNFRIWLFKKIFLKEPKNFYPREIINLIDSEDPFKNSVARDLYIRFQFIVSNVHPQSSDEVYREGVEGELRLDRRYDPSIHKETKEEFYKKKKIQNDKNLKVWKKNEDENKKIWKKHREDKRAEEYFEKYGTTEKKDKIESYIYIAIFIFAIIGIVSVYNSIKDAIN